MSDSDIVRAWKDEQFRKSLSSEQHAATPDNPAGEIELDDAELSEASGAGTNPALTAGCCKASVNYDTCQLGWCIGSAAGTPATIVCLSVQSC